MSSKICLIHGSSQSHGRGQSFHAYMAPSKSFTVQLESHSYKSWSPCAQSWQTATAAQAAVSVTDCCVTNYHKCGVLKQQHFFISPQLCSERSGMACSWSVLRLIKADSKVLSRQVQFLSETLRKKSAPKIRHAVGRILFLVVIHLRSLFSSSLGPLSAARGHPYSLACGLLHPPANVCASNPSVL